MKTHLAWFSVVLFTILQLLIETLTNTMTDSLMYSFNIDHTKLGILSSSFFYSFLALQLPAALILDRFNIKWVLSITCAGCGLGCVLFSHSTNFIFACISRSIMGTFAAFGFLGLLKVSAQYYQPKIFPLLVGFSQFIVMLVTAFIEPLYSKYVIEYSWRLAIASTGYIAFIIALLIFVFVGTQKKEQINSKIHFTKNLRILFSDKQSWLAGIYGWGMFSVVAAFSALWGMSLLIFSYNQHPQDAAYTLSMNFTGIALGCSLLGLLSSYLKNYSLILRINSFLSLILILILIIEPSLSNIQLNFIFLLLGISCSSYFLAFDIIKKALPRESQGLAIAFCNIFVMSSALLLQPIMGALIDLVNATSVVNYKFSMILLVLTLSIAFTTSFFIKNN